ncbi:hypothetical protein PV04_10200 [Phialophora macrospora]|uniref:Uncharacterized protein n=1 Tax=Phialophora macrospora TaxID=1851006 RepID=A0A0D2FTF9_9EURO|nr:hypothetical protein PV04_10200 [Phialophora macrospora]
MLNPVCHELDPTKQEPRSRSNQIEQTHPVVWWCVPPPARDTARKTKAPSKSNVLRASSMDCPASSVGRECVQGIRTCMSWFLISILSICSVFAQLSASVQHSLSELQHHKDGHFCLFRSQHSGHNTSITSAPALLHLQEFERAARDVIVYPQQIPEFANEKVAVVGGMATMRQITGRTTEDIDLLVTMADAKKRLLALPYTPFRDEPTGLWYRPGWAMREFQVDLMHDSQFPYLPEAAAAIDTVHDGPLPYISAVDLRVFKVFSCGMHHLPNKSLRDARDAESLMDIVSNPGPGPAPPFMTDEQKQVVRDGLSALASVWHPRPVLADCCLDLSLRVINAKSKTTTEDSQTSIRVKSEPGNVGWG